MKGPEFLWLAGLFALATFLVVSGCRSAPDKQSQESSPAPSANVPAQSNPSDATAPRRTEVNPPPVSDPAAMHQDETMTVTEVQTRLRDLGYNPGPVDGKMGKGTTAALKS